ncbi:hypothetical protein F5Y18DRAFT_180350 [Xylariaceae sp. FL1019]|nr:hypothetical protein F5Y18DRAFT_180350 [Xylariaceae sp. FL1019]
MLSMLPFGTRWDSARLPIPTTTQIAYLMSPTPLTMTPCSRILTPNSILRPSSNVSVHNHGHFSFRSPRYKLWVPNQIAAARQRDNVGSSSLENKNLTLGPSRQDSMDTVFGFTGPVSDGHDGAAVPSRSANIPKWSLFPNFGNPNLRVDCCHEQNEVNTFGNVDFGTDDETSSSAKHNNDKKWLSAIGNAPLTMSGGHCSVSMWSEDSRISIVINKRRRR